METPEGFWSAVILSIIGGGVAAKAMDFLRESFKGRTDKRRAEVDKMAALVTEEKLKAVAAENARVAAEEASDGLLRRARDAEEALAECRMMLLSTGKFTREQIPDVSSE